MPSLGTLRPGLPSALALAAAALLAGGAEAARVVDVRVGLHSEFTRVVFELDEHAEYEMSRVELPSGVTELTLRIEADAQPTAIARSRGLVESVRLLRMAHGSAARVRLRTGHARVKEMTLVGPPRIVVDVSRPPGAAPALPAPAPAPRPSPEAAGQPVRVAAVPAAEETPSPAPPAPEPEPAAADEAPATRDEEAATADEVPPAEAPEAVPGEEAVELLEPAPPVRPAAPPAEAPQEAPARPPPAPMRPSPGDGAPWLDPRLIGTVLLILILLLAWRRMMRRRAAAAAEAEEFPPLTGLDEEPLPPPPPPRRPEADEDLPVERTGPPAAPLAPTPAPEPPSALSGEALVRELERRIHHLERQVEEMGDARERLERGLASHTEELRVQRSAIARAQRVLRSMTRPEDDPAAPDPGRGPTR